MLALERVPSLACEFLQGTDTPPLVGYLFLSGEGLTLVAQQEPFPASEPGGPNSCRPNKQGWPPSGPLSAMGIDGGSCGGLDSGPPARPHPPPTGLLRHDEKPGGGAGMGPTHLDVHAVVCAVPGAHEVQPHRRLQRRHHHRWPQSRGGKGGEGGNTVEGGRKEPPPLRPRALDLLASPLVPMTS